MRYIVNQIWQHKDTKIYYRILHVFPELEIICWINILKVEDLPESISFEHIEQLYNDGLLNYISNEIVKLTLPENLTQQTKEKWEFHWGLIKDYVVDRELLYNKKKINYLINIKIPSEAGIPRTTVRRIFSRYWQRGMTKLAIVPDYSNSGGKGKNKAVSEAKRGRPGKYKDSKLNVDERLRKILVSGYNELYLKNPEASLKSAYEIFLALKFPNIKRSSRSKEIPSFTQFRYWGELAFPKSDRINKRVGDIIFKKDYKIITDSSRKDVNGPGSIFQIDSTPADIELVSEMDDSLLTGRPTLYLVIDVYSGMIAGFHASYENPSYLIATLALANAIENKVEFCLKYNIKIDERDWPSSHLPSCIVADRAELLGNQAENLVEEFGITVANTAAYRPDMKGLVERHFQTVHKGLKALPRKVGIKSKRDGERGVRNAKLDANLTLGKYIQIIIKSIINYNKNTFLENYPMDSSMKRDELIPTPINLWNWGIINRTGALRVFNDKEFIARVLPQKQVSLNKTGIRLFNNYYNIEEGPSEVLNKLRDIQISNQGKSIPVTVAYHPWDLSQVYLHFEGCRIILRPSQSRNPMEKNCNQWDIEHYNVRLKKQFYLHEEQVLDKKIEFIQDINEITKQAQQNNKGKRKTSSTKKIRDNRLLEKNINRQKESKVEIDDSAHETKIIDINKHHANSNFNNQDYKFPSFLDDLEDMLNE